MFEVSIQEFVVEVRWQDEVTVPNKENAETMRFHCKWHMAHLEEQEQ